MRVLHVLRSMNVGGVERLVCQLAMAQIQHGVSVGLMLDDLHGSYTEPVQKAGAQILISDLKGGTDLSPWKIRRMIQYMRDYDVIHMHGFSLAKAIGAYIGGTPVVHTIHGLSKGVSPQSLKNHLRDMCRSWYLKRGPRILVANSKYTLEHVRSDLGQTHNDMAVVYNGCDWDGYSRADDSVEPQISEFCNSKFVIGHVSRFTRRKRIERLVRAFKLFVDHCDGVLLLVGDGDQMGPLRSLIATQSLVDKVRLIGLQPQPWKYYEMMDVCVFPAEGEGFGLVAIEAYHAGIPVIVFDDGGGLLEIVRPFEPRDIVDSECSLANRLLEYYARRDRICEDSVKRRKYAQQFSVERMTKAYDDLYRKAIEGSF